MPGERIVQAAKEHDPDVIGMSGLLVKSTRPMVQTADDLAAAGIDVPLLLGGAALSLFRVSYSGYPLPNTF